MQQQDQHSESKSAVLGEYTLADVLHVILRKWPVVAICFAVALSAGAFYAFTRVPIYRAEVLVTPVTKGTDLAGGDLMRFAGQFSGVASMLGIDLAAEGNDREVSVATLNSRKFLESFARDHDLMRLLYPTRWNHEQQRFRPDIFGRTPTMDDTIREFTRHIFSVNEDRRTGLIRVRIEWHDPQQAAAWANELVQRVNLVTQQRAVAEAQRNIAFLRNELGKTSIVGVQESIYRLIEAQLNRQSLARSRDEYAFQVIDPAVVPASTNYVRPRRLRLIMFASAVGLMLGALVATVIGIHRKSKG